MRQSSLPPISTKTVHSPLSGPLHCYQKGIERIRLELLMRDLLASQTDSPRAAAGNRETEITCLRLAPSCSETSHLWLYEGGEIVNR
jgi:hypothetical protein